MAKPKGGLAKDPRIRERQTKTLEAYAEQAPQIGGDPAADRAAMVVAVERGGYTRPSTESAKVAQFMKLWKSDESRAYLAELWGLAIDESPDPVSTAFRMLHTHMVQEDESWGPRDRGSSLAASRQVLGMFVPNQTAKVATMNLSAKIERPAHLDQEQEMQSRSILPAGQKIAKPTGPTGSDDDDEDEDDE